MIPLTKPFFSDEELAAVKDTFESGWVAGQGPKNRELTEEFQRLTRTKYAIPVNNCTAGLHLALLALGIKPADEVIVSDYTFPATGHVVLYCGARPRFVDVRRDTYNLAPDLIEDKINERTKAIIVVHTFGQMAEMDPILKTANKYGLKVIEDAACAFGAGYKGKPAGSLGDIGCFSFHARKTITCGEGGIVVTNNPEYGEKIKALSSFGITPAYQRQESFEVPLFDTIGYNYRLSDINAGIVLAQLKKHLELIRKKKVFAQMYDELLRENEWVVSPFVENDNIHVYQSYVVVLDERIDRDKIIVSLKQNEIQTQIGTYALHLQPVYNSSDLCPNSAFLFHHSLALPLYYQMSEEDVSIVVANLNKHIRKQLKGT